MMSTAGVSQAWHEEHSSQLIEYSEFLRLGIIISWQKKE